MQCPNSEGGGFVFPVYVFPSVALYVDVAPPIESNELDALVVKHVIESVYLELWYLFLLQFFASIDGLLLLLGDVLLEFHFCSC